MKPPCIVRNHPYPMQFPSHVLGKGRITHTGAIMPAIYPQRAGSWGYVTREEPPSRSRARCMRGEMHREAREASEKFATLTGRNARFHATRNLLSGFSLQEWASKVLLGFRRKPIGLVLYLFKDLRRALQYGEPTGDSGADRQAGAGWA